MVDEVVRVIRLEPKVRDGKLYIDADVELAVTGDLRHIAQKGVPVYFTADVEIVSERWWWFDKVVVNEQQTWRIVYRSEEHTSELQSLMRISYAVFCLKKKQKRTKSYLYSATKLLS